MKYIAGQNQRRDVWSTYDFINKGVVETLPPPCLRCTGGDVFKLGLHFFFGPIGVNMQSTRWEFNIQSSVCRVPMFLFNIQLFVCKAPMVFIKPDASKH